MMAWSGAIVWTGRRPDELRVVAAELGRDELREAAAIVERPVVLKGTASGAYAMARMAACGRPQPVPTAAERAALDVVKRLDVLKRLVTGRIASGPGRMNLR
jgi:hypothetical protein